ncbi:hypothetical protein AK812_SmicGene17670 [Symbiodinium microadriaticum]|uniref:Uncharacterized protein n=1 Tax=Symbiodinium microadriaticum TaxID=2951 RepID=A0A1Q9DX39_SYMMI|nr:hypothetical protein AK812_SmicGene17670 [Symbiodinium microadriaticum]
MGKKPQWGKATNQDNGGRSRSMGTESGMLTEEREQADQGWAMFQDALREKSRKEREKYKADVARLDQKLEESQAAQKQAFLELQEAMSTPAVLISPPPQSGEAEESEAWDELLGTCEDSDTEMTEAVIMS